MHDINSGVMVSMPDDPAQIVRFWHAAEMFSPQQLPKTDAKNNVADYRPGNAMPWEPARKRRPEPGKVWRHEVFGGVYDLSKIRDILVQKYGQDDPEAPSRGQSALFACTLDADGYLLEESAVLSACAWAIGRIIRGMPILTGFREDARDYAEVLHKRTGVTKILADSILSAVPDMVSGGMTAAVTTAFGANGGPLAAAGRTMAGSLAGKLTKSAVGTKSEEQTKTEADGESRPRAGLDQAPLTGSELYRFTAELADRFGVTTELHPRNIRVNSYQISISRADEPAERQTFLNSYIADDLALVRTALDRRDAGTALGQYLTASPGIARTDVQKEPLCVRAGCAPDRIPVGRWVTDTGRPLAFSQQFAVNQILRTLGDSCGLFAVNGPPGTGKTTMLRDVIAAIVVKRAIELACLASPSEAFTTVREDWQPVQYSHTITTPNPKLTGFEIVVASSNNGAVENVSKEIPGPKGIDGQWREAATAVNYFSQIVGFDAWAMVAARLGNRANRAAFARDFWFDSDVSIRNVLRQSAAPDWQAAVTSFRRALSRVKDLSAERSVVSHAITRLPFASRDRARADADLESAIARREKFETEQQDADRRLREAEDRWQMASAAVAAHRPGRPGLFALLSGRGRTVRRIWEAEHAELNSRFVAADLERDATSRAVQDVADRLAKARLDEGNGRRTRDRLTRELEELRHQVHAARLRWGDHVPDGPEYAETAEPERIRRREKSAPWADAEFSGARTELFLAALALHKALILAEAPTFRQNLSALMDILGGKGRPNDAATLAAWQTFFLVVPVVSTTFASLDKLFGGLGRESVGWLFVDEAGQAPPQYAVGALWRARRAVIVGDPLQLKPVVTLPWGGQRALLREFGVGEQWAPSRTSVQQVADRLAAHGTALPGPASDEAVWVGTPLRVHRRCDRPMFGISNQIAYDGLMVFGTPDRPAFRDRNVWCDIRSATANGHWIPAEGAELRSVLCQLRDAEVPAAQIRVISPFRMVASQATKVHESIFPEVSGPDRDNWVGTVHVMQGKEADVVVLVLGGNPDRPGAREFATREPNLLNVAVTRAKRRIYVIGNRGTWGNDPYFNVLAARIPAGHPALDISRSPQ